MARVGVETKHSAGHDLTAMREASFGESNLLEPSTLETASPVAPGVPPERFFDYVLNRQSSIVIRLGPNHSKARIDRHESDT